MKKKDEWKISYFRWFYKIVNTCIYNLLIPLIFFIVLVEDFNLNIMADTFFSVFFVLFILRISFVISNPPKYAIIKSDEKE